VKPPVPLKGELRPNQVYIIEKVFSRNSIKQKRAFIIFDKNLFILIK
jgi:hypothetical protein